MRIGPNWRILDETPTTMEEARRALEHPNPPDVIFAHDQTEGRGRRGRVWVSEPGESLTFSILLHAYANWPKPHLLGMAMAIAAAKATGAKVRWPNDIHFGNRKVGGILTLLYPNQQGESVAVVGIGINVAQRSFPPEVADRATSLLLEHGEAPLPIDVARAIVREAEFLADPFQWSRISAAWAEVDETKGKRYRLVDGTEVEAEWVGSEGQLIARRGSEHLEVLAAEGIFDSRPA